jgi:hypothetical protein
MGDQGKWKFQTHNIHSFIPLAHAEYDDSLLFSGAFSVPLCFILFPATLFHPLFFHPTSLHLVIYFLVYHSTLLFRNSYVILFWEFYFLPFSVHAQTNIIYVTQMRFINAETLLYQHWESSSFWTCIHHTTFEKAKKVGSFFNWVFLSSG